MPRKAKGEPLVGQEVISFRLEAEAIMTLTTWATKEGLSANLLAQRFVTERLKTEGQSQADSELVGVRTALEQLQNNLKVVCHVLLTDAGRAEPTEAEDFVRTHLK